MKRHLVALITCCILAMTTAWAGNVDYLPETNVLETKEYYESIDKKTTQIEALEEKESSVSEESEESLLLDDEKSRLAAMINNYVEFGGAIEMEYLWERDFEKKEISDISLETAEMDFEIYLSKWAVGTLAFEWDVDIDKLFVKEGYITFGNRKKNPLYLQTGRNFVPFGISTGAVVGDTLSISDPLTVEIFETKADYVLLGYGYDEELGFNAAIYVFNGDTNSGGGDDHIEHFGATVRYAGEISDLAYAFGVDFINCVFESEPLKEVFPGALEASYAPGIAAHFDLSLHGFSIVGEYNGALEHTKFVTIPEDEEEEEEEGEALNIAPRAWQVELGYETKIYDKDVYYSYLYTRSNNLHGAFAKKRYMLNVGVWLHDGILLGLEYLHEKDYDKDHGGTDRAADSVIAQLAFEW